MNYKIRICINDIKIKLNNFKSNENIDQFSKLNTKIKITLKIKEILKTSFLSTFSPNEIIVVLTL
jgi:hypothetical protein